MLTVPTTWFIVPILMPCFSLRTGMVVGTSWSGLVALLFPYVSDFKSPGPVGITLALVVTTAPWLQEPPTYGIGGLVLPDGLAESGRKCGFCSPVITCNKFRFSGLILICFDTLAAATTYPSSTSCSAPCSKNHCLVPEVIYQ